MTQEIVFDPSVEESLMSEIGCTKQVMNKYVKTLETSMKFPPVVRNADSYAEIADHWNTPATKIYQADSRSIKRRSEKICKLIAQVFKLNNDFLQLQKTRKNTIRELADEYVADYLIGIKVNNRKVKETLSKTKKIKKEAKHNMDEKRRKTREKNDRLQRQFDRALETDEDSDEPLTVLDGAPGLNDTR